VKVLAQHTEDIADFPSWTAPAAVPAPAPVPAAPRSAEATRRFEFVAATDDYDRPDIQAAWARLLEVRQGAETLYQLPGFFRYLKATREPGEAASDLYLVRRQGDGRIVGIVPGRETSQGLRFRLGPFRVAEYDVPLYQVLGSVPLLDPAEEGLAEFVFKSLLERHPRARALLMQAVPEELGDAMRADGLSCHVVEGWRDCHTVPLPDTVDAYLQKLSAKKRYNLSRQVRLLAKEAGEVSLVRIEHPEQVALLIDGMRSLPSAKKMASPQSQAKYESQARHGLLHAYVLQCGGQTAALVLGSRSNDVWHVHKICCKQEHLALSVGTSIIHLALQDTIAHFDFTCADFGYGTPNQEFRSTHVLQRRGKLLMCQRNGLTSLLYRFHGIQDRLNEALIAHLKTLRNRLRQRRQAAK
jgi:CelD/BcsL family acetyltransferase involved in cellulose biosynthesis